MIILPSAKRVASRYASPLPGDVRDDNEAASGQSQSDVDTDTASGLPGSSDSPVKVSDIEPPENGSL
jgi:hypothetical protein